MIEEEDILNLSDLLNHLSLYIEEGFPDTFNIRAEISNVKQQGFSKHYYFEIIERDEITGNQTAKINATCWKKTAEVVIPKFEREFGEKIKTGIICNFSVTITYNPVYGLSLNIKNIVPAFTVGAHEKKKNEIRSEIEKKGISHLQKIKKAPKLITSIAILSPSSASGFKDFISEAKKWHNLGLSKIKAYSSLFEGEHATTSIVESLMKIKSDNDESIEKTGRKLYDLVVILRGGGAKSSLAYLDNIHIIENVLNLDIPVWSAIGHEDDSVLLDEYCNKAFHTPSKSAAEITNMLRNEMDEFKRSMVNINNLSLYKIKSSREDLSKTLDKIRIKTVHKIDNVKKSIILIKEKIRLQDPTLILEKGYSIIYNENGRVESEKDLIDSQNLYIKTIFGNYEITIKGKKND